MTDTTTNDVFLAEGDEARREIEKKGFVKTKYVKLKDGESIRGFLLDIKPPAYYNHGDYDKGIKSFPCADPHGKNGSCLGCQNGIKRTKMLLVPFYNVDTKAVEIFDANSKHGKTIYSFGDSYGEDAVTTPIMFKRTGESTSTVYSIMPVPPKEAKDPVFVKPAELVIGPAFYAEVLTIPDAEYIRGLIGLAPTTPTATPVDAASEGALPPVTATDGF